MAALKTTRAMRSKEHKLRMAERRERQLARTANHLPFGRKMLREVIIDDEGKPKTIVFGVERQDEQGAYRAKHWAKNEGELLNG